MRLPKKQHSEVKHSRRLNKKRAKQFGKCRMEWAKFSPIPPITAGNYEPRGVIEIFKSVSTDIGLLLVNANPFTGCDKAYSRPTHKFNKFNSSSHIYITSLTIEFVIANYFFVISYVFKIFNILLICLLHYSKDYIFFRENVT